MTLDLLVCKKGQLAETFSLFDPSTIQHASEITRDRRSNEKLRDDWFSTADSVLYRIEDGGSILYFGRRETNLVFANIVEATEQLQKNKNYKLRKEDITEVIDSVESGNTLKIKLSDLELKGNKNEWSYFEISVTDYDSLNPTQRAFAEKVYGQGDDFEKNIKMFRDAGLTAPRIYVLNPEYIKKHIEQDNAILRASSISYFRYQSNFYAVARCVTSKNGVIRGILLPTTVTT